MKETVGCEEKSEEKSGGDWSSSICVAKMVVNFGLQLVEEN